MAKTKSLEIIFQCFAIFLLKLLLFQVVIPWSNVQKEKEAYSEIASKKGVLHVLS